ncbi:MAG TPA: PAS domain-containing protein [Dongiaceae bacterium]|jgi:PAS domain-containing protein|nr:PAS domain-containing protein [Dongiaceae bacterium]
MAEDRLASAANALLRIQHARSLEEAVQIASEAARVVSDARAPSAFDLDAPFRYLFERNPTPMWVYDLATLAFLEVNEAALRHYGYEREEFLPCASPTSDPRTTCQSCWSSRPTGRRACATSAGGGTG